MNLKAIGKMQDTISIGMLGGLIGTICMELSNMLIYKAKKSEVVYPQITGQFFFSPKRVNRKENFMLGELLHLGVGIFFGMPLILILKTTGKDNYLSKGLLTGMTTWGILYAGGQKLGLFKQPIKTKTHYSAVWNNVLYGLVSAQAMVTLADSRIFASEHKLDLQPQEQLEKYYDGTTQGINQAAQIVYH